jgi:hypothetical protein
MSLTRSSASPLPFFPRPIKPIPTEAQGGSIFRLPHPRNASASTKYYCAVVLAWLRLETLTLQNSPDNFNRGSNAELSLTGRHLD